MQVVILCGGQGTRIRDVAEDVPKPMIPIGGTFTMPPDTAREVLQQLKPKIAIPMHYREDMSLLGMFLTGLKSRRLRGNTLRPAHVAEVIVTSALIPPLSVFWRLVGAAQFRARFF